MKARVMSVFAAATVMVGASSPVFAQTAETPVLPDETISGITNHKLPTPPVHPARYTLPMVIKVVKDAGITTDTPITDQYKSDYPKWAEAIRACLKSKPVLVRVVGEETVPFVVNGSEGTTKLNANDKAVCKVS